MKTKSSKSSESIIRDIKRKTRRKFSSEEKIRIVLDGLRGEDSVASICRREGINPNLYYNWSKSFLEAGKRRLNGDTQREASSDEVSGLRNQNLQLRLELADLYMQLQIAKKNHTGLE